jgi:hypothetical protein
MEEAVAMTDDHRWPGTTAVVVATVVRHGCLEFLRNRWLPMVGIAIAIALTAGQFAAALALTETDALRIAIVLPLLRLFAVLIVSVLVVGSFAREAADRSRQLALAAPIGRSTWLAARFSAGGVLAVATAVAVTVAAATVVVPAMPDPAAGIGGGGASATSTGTAGLLPALAAWSFTLGCELLIVAAVAGTVVLALAQPAAALLATLAIYVGGRAIGVILALDARAGAASDSPAFDAATSAVLHAVAAVLPRLDQFARTDWLLGTLAPAVGWPLLQTLVYVALAFTVAVIDLRRNEA